MPDELLLAPGYRLHDFRATDAVPAADVVAMWLAHGVLEPEEAERRVGEVVVAVTHESSAGAAGVVTAHLLRHPQLGATVWNLRGFTADAHRRSGAVLNATVLAIEILERRFVAGDSRGLGMTIEIEHPGLAKHITEAVYPWTGAHFIGLPRGNPTWIRWFPGVEIPA